MWRYNILLDCIRIKSTDGNFGTREKVAIPIPIVTCTVPIPIPIFGIFAFPFPWESHGNGNPIPMHISTWKAMSRCHAGALLISAACAQSWISQCFCDKFTNCPQLDSFWELMDSSQACGLRKSTIVQHWQYIPSILHRLLSVSYTHLTLPTIYSV